MSQPTPLSGAAHDAGRLHLRYTGAAAAVRAIAADIGGETTPETFWDDLRHLRLPFETAPRLWRLSVARTATLPDLPGPWLRDWAGGMIWLAGDAPGHTVRALAEAAGGHATLFRGAEPGEEVFAPLAPPLLALHRRLAAAFDPAGVFNPGRMYEEL